MKQYVWCFSTSCIVLFNFFYPSVRLACWHQHMQFGWYFQLLQNFRPFSQIMYNEFTRFSVLQIMYERYYYQELTKIRTFVKYSIGAFHGFILPKYNLPLSIEKHKFPWLSWLFLQCCFPGFLTASNHLVWCFLMFSLVFLQFPWVFLQFLSVLPLF